MTICKRAVSPEMTAYEVDYPDGRTLVDAFGFESFHRDVCGFPVREVTGHHHRDGFHVTGRSELDRISVPPPVRAWSVPWPDYAPTDITPPELTPAALPAAVDEGWAEPYPRPRDVPDWPARLAGALVPYTLDAQGWPQNPTGRTGRVGRNLGKWGENAAADPIVIAGDGAGRRVLLVRREDIGQWAIPGGMVDAGESAPAALVRELREETDVDLTDCRPLILARIYVEDWRASDHAWVCSTVALYRLPATVAVSAGDDATDARWWPAPSLETLTAALEPHGGLYAAHRPLLTLALRELA